MVATKEGEMTAEEIVRLLVEELGDAGRQVPIRDSWNTTIATAYHLSNPLMRAAREWVRVNGSGA